MTAVCLARTSRRATPTGYVGGFGQAVVMSVLICTENSRRPIRTFSVDA